jgi:hypothetical protein
MQTIDSIGSARTDRRDAGTMSTDRRDITVQDFAHGRVGKRPVGWLLALCASVVFGLVVMFSSNAQAQTIPSANFTNTAKFGGELQRATVVGDFNSDGRPDIAVASYGTNTVTVFLASATQPLQYETPITISGWPLAQPTGMVAADFNGDGILDLAVVNESNGLLVILEGAGDGNFFAANSTFATDGAQSLAVADFDGDGNLDVAVTSLFQSTFTVLLGNGAGLFPISLEHDELDWNVLEPAGLAAADMNLDGHSDLVIASYADDSILVWLGGGDGYGIGTSIPLVAGFAPNAVRLVDVDGDGRLDIVVVGVSSVAVLRATAQAGVWGSPEYLMMPFSSGSDVTVADVNGDGKLDIVAVAYLDAVVGIAYGHGDGTFEPAAAIGLPDGAMSIAAGDLNSDGRIDLVAGGFASEMLYLMRNTGNGSVVVVPPTTIYPSPPSNLACSGVRNGARCTFDPAGENGGPAVIEHTLYCRSESSGQLFSATGAASPLTVSGLPTNTYYTCYAAGTNANGQGLISTPVQIIVRSDLVRRGQVDVDGDGRLDLYLRNVFGLPEARVARFVSSGGMWQLRTRVAADAGFGIATLGIGDFLGVSRADILVQNATGDVSIAFSGDTSPDSLRFVRNANLAWKVQAVADMDGDGKSDIVWRHETVGSVFVWLMDGGNIKEIRAWGSASNDWQVVGAGDLDGDGKADLVWQNTVSGDTQIAYSRLTPTFEMESIGTAAPGYSVVFVSDFNSDGKDDLLLRRADGSLQVWLMNGTTVTAQIVVLPTQEPSVRVFAVGDVDGDGRADIIFRLPDGVLTIYFMRENISQPLVAEGVGIVQDAFEPVTP